MSRNNNQFAWKDGITLKEYFEKEFQDVNNKIELQFELRDVALEKSNVLYEARHEILENKIDSVQKIIYIGMGAVMAIDFILKFFVK
jgi:hypothetical protein